MADPISWTTEPPTVPGWYWAKEEQGDASMVQILEDDTVGEFCMIHHFHENGGTMESTTLPLCSFTHWNGPLRHANG